MENVIVIYSNLFILSYESKYVVWFKPLYCDRVKRKQIACLLNYRNE